MAALFFIFSTIVAWYFSWTWFKKRFSPRVRFLIRNTFYGRPNYEAAEGRMGKIRRKAKEKLKMTFRRWRSWRHREKRAWEKVHDRILSRWEMATSVWGMLRQFMPQVRGFQRPQKKNLFWNPWQGDPPSHARKHKPRRLLPILSKILEESSGYKWRSPSRNERLAYRARKAKKDRLALRKYYAEQRKKKAKNKYPPQNSTKNK